METPVDVVFRRWKDAPYRDVLALFPLLEEGPGLCASYQHIGQHGSADYAGCISRTVPADESEDDVRALRRELESIGYTLRVRARRPHR